MNLTIVFNSLKPMMPYVTMGMMFIFQQIAGNAVNQGIDTAKNKITSNLKNKAKQLPQEPYDPEIERWM